MEQAHGQTPPGPAPGPAQPATARQGLPARPPTPQHTGSRKTPSPSCLTPRQGAQLAYNTLGSPRPTPTHPNLSQHLITSLLNTPLGHTAGWQHPRSSQTPTLLQHTPSPTPRVPVTPPQSTTGLQHPAPSDTPAPPRLTPSCNTQAADNTPGLTTPHCSPSCHPPQAPARAGKRGGGGSQGLAPSPRGRCPAARLGSGRNHQRRRSSINQIRPSAAAGSPPLQRLIGEV